MSMSSIEPIGYVRETPPPVNVPPYEGDRYAAVVPDTLDLQERAGLAVNALTGPTDPDADYEIDTGPFRLGIVRRPCSTTGAIRCSASSWVHFRLCA